MTSTKTKFHRDGRITLWDVYSQTWQTYESPVTISDRILASLPDRERERIVMTSRDYDYAIEHHGERLPERYPTRKEARKALELLRDLGGTIPFADEDRGRIVAVRNRD